MEFLTLEAKSHKGKNRLAEAQRRLPKWDGKTWRVSQEKASVVFSGAQGPWAHVTPNTDENTDWCSRWVNLREDDNFTVTAYVQQQGPGDEYDDEPAFDEYMSGDQTNFLDFQFDLKDEDGEVLDWYSDSIVAWAYYPLGLAQTAVNVERERQAALVPNVEHNRRTAASSPGVRVDGPVGPHTQED